MTDDKPTPADVRARMKNVRKGLPPYRLEYAPLPVECVSRVGRKPTHNVKETIVRFYESGEPSARVRAIKTEGGQGLNDAIFALGLRGIVRAKSIGGSAWIYRLDMPQPEGFKP